LIQDFRFGILAGTA